MKSSTGSYTEAAHVGLANTTLQNSLKKLQNGFGKGAMNHWRTMPDSTLRSRAKNRRMKTLEHLDIVLAELAKNVRAHGGHVFFAETAEDAVRYTMDVAAQHNVRSVVKGKSMTSAEIGLDPALQRAGIDVVETDLGEYIIQLAGETPSHIIAPCIHMDRVQIGQLFAEKLGVDYTDDPPALTRIARTALREKLLAADMGITGCNIACAETGQIALVSNEGNIRMATTMPRVHVALMGMERIAATLDEHRDLLQLLTRGAALQKLSTYVSFIGGPRSADDPDGPETFHLVIIDNGRSKILGDPEFREVLACIRCGACLNVCPVYGRIGGHAYNSPYCGPIGAVVTPLLSGINAYGDLFQGETLCGACKEVCPLEIDLPRMLSALRHKLAYGDTSWGVTPGSRIEASGFAWWKRAIGSRKAYDMLLNIGRFMQKRRIGPNGMISSLPGPGAKWTNDRDLRPIANESFRQRWHKRYAQNHMETKP